MPTTKTYDISIGITTINGAAPTPNMEITGANLAIAGTARATVETIVTKPGGEIVSDETVDITKDLKVVIKFGSTSTTHSPTSSDGWQHWSLTLPAPIGSANADGQLLITAIAQHPDAQKPGTFVVTVNVDKAKPTLTILRPLADETIVLPRATVSLPLEGIATDNRQVAEVKWSLDSKDYNNALALDQTGRGNTQVQIPDARQHTINVRAKDSSTNVNEQSVTVDVVPPFTPVDPADLTGQISYLGDLLGFAAKRINVSTSTPPSPAEPTLPSATDFSNIFCQRFNELIDPQNHA